MTEEQVRAHLGEEFFERHERVQRRLLAMLEALKRRDAERRASGAG